MHVISCVKILWECESHAKNVKRIFYSFTSVLNIKWYAFNFSWRLFTNFFASSRFGFAVPWIFNDSKFRIHFSSHCFPSKAHSQKDQQRLYGLYAAACHLWPSVSNIYLFYRVCQTVQKSALSHSYDEFTQWNNNTLNSRIQKFTVCAMTRKTTEKIQIWIKYEYLCVPWISIKMFMYKQCRLSILSECSSRSRSKMMAFFGKYCQEPIDLEWRNNKLNDRCER